MKHQLLFDKINNLESVIRGLKNLEEKKKEIIDTVLDLLIMAYVFGTDEANNTLGTEIKPDAEEIESAVYKKIADKTFVDRLEEYSTAEEIIRVIETDANRTYNDAVLNTARKSGKEVFKTWITMADDKVRDTHFYIDSLTVPLEDRFYTFDGDSALYPCGFEKPENNCNCRCHIEVHL